MIYLLLLLGILIFFRYLKDFFSIVSTPPAKEYFHLIKHLSNRENETQESLIKTKFMQFVVDLSIQSLNENKAVGYFRLPQLGKVFVLSSPSVIHQFYIKDNEPNFNQLRFFNRLSIILGADNLMSSPLRSSTHTQVRKSIFNRNEQFIPHLNTLVKDFFLEFFQKNRSLPLADVMDALSRRILLTVYFDKSIVAIFEKKYDAKLTKALLHSLFELEIPTDSARTKLLALRERLFAFGSDLLLSPMAKKALFVKNNWLSYLLSVRMEKNPEVIAEFAKLGIRETSENLNERHWKILLQHAFTNKDSSLLTSIIRDVVNESLFIPLLGFDATASMLITSLRIALQEPRINAIVKKEITELAINNHTLELQAMTSSKLSYTQAVILEALRLSPPAPIIPEIIIKTVSLQINDKILKLPPGSLVFIPMEGLHTHSANYPDIMLSKKGQGVFFKNYINSKVIFPERWKPVNPQGKVYNSDLIKKHSNPDSFFAFKKGARQCPGQRLAMSEALSVFQLFATHDFQLTNEEPLLLPFSYNSPFQRNGGQEILHFKPK